MPTYKITDPLSGKMLKVTGDSPPSEDELSQLFSPYTPHQGPEIADSFAGKQSVSADETDNPDKAYWDSLKETGKGFVKGALSNLNPINMVKGAANMAKLAAPVILPGPIGNQMGMEAGRGMIEGLKRVVGGDPEAGGAAVGGLLMGKFAPEIAAGTSKAAPSVLRGAGLATELVGQGTEAVGRSAGRMGRYGVIPTAITGHPVAAAAELIAPPIIRGTGRVMQKAGKGMRNLGDMMDSARRAPEDVPVRDAVPVDDSPLPMNDVVDGEVIQPKRLDAQAGGPFEMPPSTPKPQTFEESASASPVADTMQRMIESSNPTAELGMPRVKQWKDGKGPTQSDMQKARDYGGGKDAAARLKVPQKRVYAETNAGSGVPQEAQARIKAAVANMSPDEFTAYLSQARGPVRAFIHTLRP